MEKVTIEILEKYLADRYNGWATDQRMLLKLVEEIGEVAEIVNMKAGIKSTEKSTDQLNRELGIELADMIHYIVAIAAINGIDLNTIILEKDKVASVKYNHTINLEEFILKEKNKKK
ncbi:MAG: nucleotide pyrophosphohydrolase [Clostridia bacterium]|nr:nucleotide pyrophosphohydrolase [Clostridia bacterium]